MDLKALPEISPWLYLFIGLGINLPLALLLQFRTYQRLLKALILSAALLFPVMGCFLILARQSPPELSSLWMWKTSLLLTILCIAHIPYIAHLVFAIQQKTIDGPVADTVQKTDIYGWIIKALIPIALCIAIITLFIPSSIIPFAQGDVLTWMLTPSMYPLAMMGFAITALYQLERAYRFSQSYQRKIGRLVYLSLFAISIAPLPVMGRLLLYGTLGAYFTDTLAIISLVAYPTMLMGLLRYRLGTEKINIPRETITTSLTLLLTGSVFLAVAATVVVVQNMGFSFRYFEAFFLGFTLCFGAIIVLGSGSMRRHLIRTVNRHLYSQKYDYYEQFYRLHKTFLAGEELEDALTDLVENMKYTLTASDAVVYLHSDQDGNFHARRNKEVHTHYPDTLPGSHPLIRSVSADGRYIDFTSSEKIIQDLLPGDPLLAMKSSAIFALPCRGETMGLLILIGGGLLKLDAEDVALIESFAQTIGAVLYQNRVQKERIHQKQFESFHHIVSFIVHDIKNQVATLSLLVKNAEKNLSNPDFQTSMVRSVQSCAMQLESLMGRLSVAPKQTSLQIVPISTTELIAKVESHSGLLSDHLIWTLEKEIHTSHVYGHADPLFFVLRNLVRNAQEAMPQGGQMGVRIVDVDRLDEQHILDFGGNRKFFGTYQTAIVFWDRGPGMDAEFLSSRLFSPFATTKEKGVGIGLYQCKTLIEKMGGRLLCHSELQVGTKFCILLGQKI